MRSLRFGRFWLVSGLVLLMAILVLALSPSNRTVTVELFSDKLMHGLTFFVLMVWFCGIFRMRLAPVIALSLMSYGILIEFLQSRLPYRSAELGDVIFDCAGILLGWAVSYAGLKVWTQTVEGWFGKTTQS